MQVDRRVEHERVILTRELHLRVETLARELGLKIGTLARELGLMKVSGRETLRRQDSGPTPRSRTRTVARGAILHAEIVSVTEHTEQTSMYLDLDLITRWRVKPHAVDIRLRGVRDDDCSVLPRRGRATQLYLGGWIVPEER